MSGIVELVFREFVVTVDSERYRHQRIVVVIKKNKFVLMPLYQASSLECAGITNSLNLALYFSDFIFACLNTLYCYLFI